MHAAPSQVQWLQRKAPLACGRHQRAPGQAGRSQDSSACPEPWSWVPSPLPVAAAAVAVVAVAMGTERGARGR